MANPTHLNKTTPEVDYWRSILLALASAFLFATPSWSSTPNSKKVPRKEKLITNKSKAHESKHQEGNKLRVGIGGGLQNVYLPSLGVEASATFGALIISAEFGFFQISKDSFAGKTSFFGLGGRWIPSVNHPLFLGLALGNRDIEVSTVANMNFTDNSTNERIETPVTWKRSISQFIAYPKVGWAWREKQRLSILGFGLVIPISSKSEITGAPSEVSGVSEEAYQAIANEKLNDVTSKTNLILPALEFKYLYLLN